MMRALVRRPTNAMQSHEPAFVPQQKVNVEAARQQHDVYCEVLKSLDVEVCWLDECPTHAQAVAIDHTALVLNDVAVVAALDQPRQGELPAVTQWLSREFQVKRVDLRTHPAARWEGGDMVVMGRTVLAGRSSQTNAEGIAALRELLAPLDWNVTEVEVRDCLCLKTACTPLDDETLLVRGDWLDLSALEGFRLLEAPGSEPWGANVERVGGTICLPSAHRDTARFLLDHGYRVRSIRISEFAKIEAGIASLSLWC